MNAFVADVARTWARRDRDAILAQLRDNVETGVTPPGVPRLAPLADAVLHGLDIRIPLGRSVPVDHESFVLLADWFTGLRGPAAMLLGGSTKRRLTGVRVVAEDLDCAYGTGAEARGRSDVVLAALGGRSVPADSLSGPGAGLLRSRLPAPAAGTEKPDLR
ncbi:hypothetical protein [Mobilicoccus massiliensis]|uniref:hypothetical protein n=1 Tax=Mobilicoccus massiliensis TaxID=1522310 RepID=UPI0006935B8E|nr:hypothetical protein [Mobilicoccus massiliensis]